MPRAIFYVFLSLLLVVSCECKDMHWRKLPEEKDIVFEGEVKADPSKKTKTYVPNESREIQIHLTSNDEEAKDAQFKILSATLADGSPADLDYTSLKIGDNTLHYTPQKPGTHELTLKVAVEGEEASAKTIHYTLEAPAAEWQVGGTADAAGNIALTITDAPEDWRSESWRITSTTFSEGLEGRIETTSEELNYGTNNLRINLDRAVLTEPHVLFTVQGPDTTPRTCRIDLIALCVAQLRGEMSEIDRSLADGLVRINDEHERETEAFFTRDEEGIYHLPPATITDPRVNREQQQAVEERLNLMERDLEAYERDLQRLEALEIQDPTRPSRQLPTFRIRRGQQRLKDAIASLKSAQVQLQQQCISAHMALFKTLENENQEAIDILLEDPKLDVNGENEVGKTVLHYAALRGYDAVTQILIEKRANVNARDRSGDTPLHAAAIFGRNEVVKLLLQSAADVNITCNLGKTALHCAANNGEYDVVKTLLCNRAIKYRKDVNGHTPLHLARKGGHKEVATLLFLE